jgi:hypothetical protein
MVAGSRERQLQRLDDDVTLAFDSKGKLTRAGRRMVRASGPIAAPLGLFLFHLVLWSAWSYMWFDLWALPEKIYEEPVIFMGAVSVAAWVFGVYWLSKSCLDGITTARFTRRSRLTGLESWRDLLPHDRAERFAAARKGDRRQEKVERSLMAAGKGLWTGFKVMNTLAGFDFAD